MDNATARVTAPQIDRRLDFLWMELTNRCNLQCSHCYAESGPHQEVAHPITAEKRLSLIAEAGAMGCKSIQFIGGEPTLDPNLPQYILQARRSGMDFIEVFTNLVRLPSGLIDVFRDCGVRVATSVYAVDAQVHDRVTTVSGSFARTIANIKKVVAAGLPIRASVIAMDENRATVDETIGFLRGIGVQNCAWDAVRAIGRADAADEPCMGELCGECAGGTLCISADGIVSPCIMSKAWPVGDVAGASGLPDVLASDGLLHTRQTIASATGRFGEPVDVCTPKTCNPYDGCSPKLGPGPCEPSGCTPCLPKG